MTEIPRGDHKFDFVEGYPAWFSVRDKDGKTLKPIIRCNCGYFCGLGLHHVHADGTVTASFFHTPECDPGRGCGWHVYLKLLDYDQGDFPPNS
jgi:hypothetical protein